MEKIRLSKRMSELGLCSRREADVYIEKGWVDVDGETVSLLGTKVYPNQQITLRTAAVNTQQQRVTILLNKPIAYVSGQAEHGYKPASAQ
jgi:23S rRNA pseudouridine2604 synthase